jgi:hypothetical protein
MLRARRWRLLCAGIVLLGAISIWLGAVARCESNYVCDRCSAILHVSDFRVLGISIYSNSTVSQSLNAQCPDGQHQFLPFSKYHFYGLIWQVTQPIPLGGTMRLK